ncbi:MAG: CDP-alcohol phosphatidyltransferase family protein [Ginsengibacter sp.]
MADISGSGNIRPLWIRSIPNLFTLLNLFFGVLAIIAALQTNTIIMYIDQDYSTSFNIPEKLSLAGIFIIIAAFIDFLDGFLSRALKASSEMGKQLDSLCDVVSFGVAPAVIVFQLLKLSFAREENGLETSMIWLMPAIILACAAAYRLAKFNLATDQQYSFKGVPVPAAGLLVASFPLILHFNEIAFINSIIINKWFLYGCVLILSYLMVSNMNIISLKFKDYTLKNNIPKIVLLVIAILAALFLHWAAIPVVFIFYILISAIFSKKIQ